MPDSKTLVNTEKGFLYLQYQFPLENETQNGKMKINILCLFLCNLALITHNAPFSVNSSIQVASQSILLIQSQAVSLNYFDSRIKHSCLGIYGELVCKESSRSFCGIATNMAIICYCQQKLQEVGLLLVGDPSKSCSRTSLPFCDLKPFSRVISPLEG